MKRVSWFVFLSAMALSCLDQPDCYQLNNNVAMFGFKIIGGGSDNVTVKSITSPGAAGAVSKDPTSSTVGIVLNPFSNEIDVTLDMAYFFAPSIHTAHIDYQSRVQFVSEDCGERFVFTDVALSSKDFDSIRVVNAVPTNPPSLNVELFRCPRTDALNVDFTNAVDIKSVKVRELNTTIEIGKSISDILLPLTLDGTKTTYEFTYADNSTKSLTVKYRASKQRRFKRCGEQTYLDRISYDPAETNFKSVVVKEDSIFDLPNQVNLEVSP